MTITTRFSGWIRTGVALCVCLAAEVTACGADVNELAQSLTAANPADRYAAADGLADLGAAAQPAVPKLIQALQSDDAKLRWRAARALGVIGDPTAAAALAKQAQDPDPLTRAQAIFALGRLKLADDASLKAIVEHLSDEDAQVRRAAVRALRMVDAPRASVRPLVIKLLNDPDPSIAMRALSALVEGGVEVVPALASALDEREARYWACLALGEIGPQAKAAVPNLIKSLTDDRPEVRLQAALALAEIGPDAKPAAGELIKLLNDPFESVRVAATFALGRLGDEASSEALQKIEATTDPSLSMMATWALAKIHKDDEQRMNQAIERLVPALGAENRQMAGMAARALADLNADQAKVRPLIDRLIAQHPEISDRLLHVLAELGPRAVPQATEALKDPQRRVRALQVLARIGADAAPAVPTLIELLKTGDAPAKTEALFTLGAIGPKAEAAVEPISDQLTDADPRVVEAAIYALGKIGPAAKAAVPKLEKLVHAEDSLVRLMAVCAILRIGPVTGHLVETALPVLTEGLKSQREYVRVEAAMTLGELGPQGQAALPALQTAATDSSTAVRSAATAAIQKIKG